MISYLEEYFLQFFFVKQKFHKYKRTLLIVRCSYSMESEHLNDRSGVLVGSTRERIIAYDIVIGCCDVEHKVITRSSGSCRSSHGTAATLNKGGGTCGLFLAISSSSSFTSETTSPHLLVVRSPVSRVAIFPFCNMDSFYSFRSDHQPT